MVGKSVQSFAFPWTLFFLPGLRPDFANLNALNSVSYGIGLFFIVPN